MDCRERKCCCGGCSDKPFDSRYAIASEIQPMQQYCIDCLPKMICVVYDNGVDPPYSRIAYRSCGDPLAPRSEGPIIYTVSIPIGASPVLLVFRYHIENGVCSFCLDDADECFPVTFYVPPSCGDPMAFTFQYDGATVTTSTADNISLRDLVNCSTCSCICRCICFHVNETVETVCAVTEDGVISWTRSDGYVIYMGEYAECNPCSLSLDDPEGNDTGDPIVITGDRGTDKACPDPVAHWQYTDDSGNIINVVFDCQYCDKCKGVSTGCCNENINRVLTAEFDLDCVSGCGDFILPLINTDGTIWHGEDSELFCSNGILLDLSCGGASFAISASHSLSYTLTSYTCSPLRIEFAVTFTELGICGDLAGSANGTIVITE